MESARKKQKLFSAKGCFITSCRKLLLFMLMITLVFGIGQSLLTTEALAATVSRQYGDVNWDGKIDSRDTSLILQHISATEIPANKKNHPDWVLTGDDYKVADVNCDKKIDSRDTLKVQEYIAASTIQNIREKHPDWVSYLNRKYSYNVSVTLSTSTVSIDEKGKTIKSIAATHNYGRSCYYVFRAVGAYGYKKRNDEWNKAKTTYTFSLMGTKAGKYSAVIDLYDTKNKTKIASSKTLTINVTNGSTSKKFKKYALSETQLTKIARLCQQEQGTVAGAKAEASLMANQLETSKARQSKYGTGANGLYKWVRNGGWFAKAAYWMDNGKVKVSKAVREGVKDVLVNGNRTLPQYVDEHDCLSDIKSISTGKVKNRGDYIKGRTIVKNKYKSTWTFYCFPDSKSDPFGYTAAAYKAVNGK